MKKLILIAIFLNYVAAQTSSVIRTLTDGHGNLLPKLVLLPNGDLVSGAIGAHSSEIQIWNTRDGVLKRKIVLNHSNRFSLAVQQNGDLVTVCHVCMPNEKRIQIWNTLTGGLKRTIEGNFEISLSSSTGVSIVLPNGDLAVGTESKIYIYDLNDGRLKRQLIDGNSNRIRALVVLPGSGYLVSGGDGNVINIWNANDGTLAKTLTGNFKLINDLVVLKNGYLVCSAIESVTNRTKVHIWNPNDGRLIRTLFPTGSQVNSLAVLLNGDLVSGSEDGKVRIWNANDGTVKNELKGRSSSVNSLKVLYNGYLASESEHEIDIWNVTTWTDFTLSGHSDAILAVVKLLNGDLASSSRDSTIKIWNTTNGSLKRTLIGHTDWIDVLVVLPSGDLVSGSYDTTIKIWSTVDGKLKRTLIGHNDWVRALAVLPSGDLVSGSDDRTIRIWNTETGELKRIISEHGDRVRQLTVLSENSFASGSDDKTVRIWHY